MSASRPARAWTAQLFDRTRQHAFIKAFGTTAFITTFFVAYFWILENPFAEVTVLPLTAVDRAIGFSSLWLPAYLSLWVYVSIPPALIADRKALDAYGVWVGLLCVSGLALFVLWPTTIPPDLIDWSASPEMGLLKGIDAAGNACPSMHVATALFSGLWLHRLLCEVSAPAWLRLFNGLWCGSIIYATLAVKQHVFIDVVGGVALGLAFAWPALRGHRKRMRALAQETIGQQTRQA
ncbi:phosphatase PAP2 family protein [Nitrogeniibacter aestuarii]|uniref:phosphatase PAP2 family protein n=1 Tax=Nitrogeniibacter aestuarii TaxID=2815343 RepID=UPI001D12A8F3|nr:phosphatase PAP2 family protein [Nitrogeniibacter aestuarii]